MLTPDGQAKLARRESARPTKEPPSAISIPRTWTARSPCRLVQVPSNCLLEAVGYTVGYAVGALVGEAVGYAVEYAVGALVGDAVGYAVGYAVGALVGDAVG